MRDHLPWLDLASPAFSTRSAEVAAARAACWCARTPYGLAVLRHREVGQLLRDRRLRQGSHAWPRLHGMSGTFTRFWERSVIGREGPDHKALRHIAVPALAPEFVDSLQPDFDRIADRLASHVARADRVEFMAEFSLPFAGQAIAILLGLPWQSWPDIARDAATLGLAMGIDCKAHEADIDAAHDRLAALSDRLIARARSGQDRTSFVARLVAGFDRDGRFDAQAVRDMMVISIFGGVDTTRSQLGLAMALFAAHPEQWQALRRDPGLVPGAVEEIIRARPTTTWSTREAIEEFDFGGVTIARGETLHMLVHASARDPAICADPSFDITARRRNHFGFGGGAHSCLGQLVARTDMASALTALARHIRSIQLDGPGEWLPDSGNTSPVALPLRVTADR